MYVCMYVWKYVSTHHIEDGVVLGHSKLANALGDAICVNLTCRTAYPAPALQAHHTLSSTAKGFHKHTPKYINRLTKGLNDMPSIKQ